MRLHDDPLTNMVSWMVVFLFAMTLFIIATVLWDKLKRRREEEEEEIPETTASQKPKEREVGFLAAEYKNIAPEAEVKENHRGFLQRFGRRRKACFLVRQRKFFRLLSRLKARASSLFSRISLPKKETVAKRFGSLKEKSAHVRAKTKEKFSDFSDTFGDTCFRSCHRGFYFLISGVAITILAVVAAGVLFAYYGQSIFGFGDISFEFPSSRKDFDRIFVFCSLGVVILAVLAVLALLAYRAWTWFTSRSTEGKSKKKKRSAKKAKKKTQKKAGKKKSPAKTDGIWEKLKPKAERLKTSIASCSKTVWGWVLKGISSFSNFARANFRRYRIKFKRRWRNRKAKIAAEAKAQSDAKRKQEPPAKTPEENGDGEPQKPRKQLVLGLIAGCLLAVGAIALISVNIFRDSTRNQRALRLEEIDISLGNVLITMGLIALMVFFHKKKRLGEKKSEEAKKPEPKNEDAEDVLKTEPPEPKPSSTRRSFPVSPVLKGLGALALAIVIYLWTSQILYPEIADEYPHLTTHLTEHNILLYGGGILLGAILLVWILSKIARLMRGSVGKIQFRMPDWIGSLVSVAIVVVVAVGLFFLAATFWRSQETFAGQQRRPDSRTEIAGRSASQEKIQLYTAPLNGPGEKILVPPQPWKIRWELQDPKGLCLMTTSEGEVYRVDANKFYTRITNSGEQPMGIDYHVRCYWFRLQSLTEKSADVACIVYRD